MSIVLAKDAAIGHVSSRQPYNRGFPVEYAEGCAPARLPRDSDSTVPVAARVMTIRRCIEQVAELQTNRGNDPLRIAASETVHEYPTVVAYGNSQTRLAVGVRGAASDPAVA